MVVLRRWLVFGGNLSKNIEAIRLDTGFFKGYYYGYNYLLTKRSWPHCKGDH